MEARPRSALSIIHKEANDFQSVLTIFRTSDNREQDKQHQNKTYTVKPAALEQTTHASILLCLNGFPAIVFTGGHFGVRATTHFGQYAAGRINSKNWYSIRNIIDNDESLDV
jgi:hypothetical protein